METKNAWSKYKEGQLNKIYELSDLYKKFLTNSKTEREFVKNTINIATKEGFKNLKEVNNLVPGDKIYVNNMDKSIALFIIGSEDIEKGLNILGAHVDSPRLDLKANPLYEESEFAYFDTHYYGGIKKYQWLSLPLAIHGVVVKKDGSKIDVNIGEKEDDPVIGITDLLPHLASDQLKKSANDFIDGENLDILVGSMPLNNGDNKEKTKDNILKILKENYNILEDDFISAEIEIVPAFPARDFGLDKSMIISYGQDDKMCAFTSLQAILNIEQPTRTALCLLVDKEEIGSVGSTGMASHFLENSLAEVCNLLGKTNSISQIRALENSFMLSSDVNAGYDPLYKSVMDLRNSSMLGHGVAFCKYTGSRGKSGASDANAEYIAKIRNIMDEANVSYQFSELGKVDIGGGGTIAYLAAKYNMNVIDSGVAVLSMHAPWEVTSKVDVYEAYKCYITFLNNI